MPSNSAMVERIYVI